MNSCFETTEAQGLQSLLQQCIIQVGLANKQPLWFRASFTDPGEGIVSLWESWVFQIGFGKGPIGRDDGFVTSRSFFPTLRNGSFLSRGTAGTVLP